MAFLSRTPHCGNKFLNVGDAISKIQAFNAIYEYGKDGSVNNAVANGLCNSEDAAAWRKLAREGTVNCQYKPTELDFFFDAFAPGGPKTIEATHLFIKSMCDFDYNIISAEAAQGNVPGGPVTFTLARSMHSADGQYANIAVNGSIYIYEDRQWIRITAVNDTTPYAIEATGVPYNGDYTANIRKGKKMMFTPVRFTDGYSCSIPKSTWLAPGYIKMVAPMRLRKDWEQPIDLSRGYEDVLQFAIIYDREGRQMDSWVPYEMQKAREELKFAKNLYAFMGERITNTALIGSGLTLETTKYAGFDGYLNTMRYGGGTVYDYDPTVGFSLDTDFMSILLRQDSLKKAKNFVVMNGLQFMASLVRNNQNTLKEATGQISLKAFAQSGMDMNKFAKLDVGEYKFLNYGLVFKPFDALTDSRSIGNHDMPNLGIAMPMEGNVDSLGNPVAPIEFFMPQGMGGENGSYEEHGPLDHRNMPEHCEKWSGYVAETVMMNVNCPQNHILMQGVNPCA